MDISDNSPPRTGHSVSGHGSLRAIWTILLIAYQGQDIPFQGTEVSNITKSSYGQNIEFWGRSLLCETWEVLIIAHQRVGHSVSGDSVDVIWFFCQGLQLDYCEEFWYQPTKGRTFYFRGRWGSHLGLLSRFAVGLLQRFLAQSHPFLTKVVHVQPMYVTHQLCIHIAQVQVFHRCSDQTHWCWEMLRNVISMAVIYYIL